MVAFGVAEYVTNGLGGVMRKQPFSFRQKVLIGSIAVLMNLPAFIWIVLCSDKFSPRQVGVVGLLNMFVGIPLLVLIGEKWIRTRNEE
jgi:hypothetical protein